MTETKINKIEKLKRSLAPYDYYEKRLAGLDSKPLDEADRFYLKNFGIYNHKLRPENFILRLRIPGGRISVEAFWSIVDMAEAAGSRIVVTSRAQIELHDLSLERAFEYSREIEKFGLSSWQTYTDNIRNIVTDPLDGLVKESKVEIYPIIMEMERIFFKNRRFVGTLPRKFNTALSGSAVSVVPFCGNDLFFALASKSGEYGFNIYAGGKSSDAAVDLDIFCRPDEAASLFKAVVETYIQDGPRGSRSKTRLFHMLQSMGAGKFRESVAKMYGFGLESAGKRVYGRLAGFKKEVSELKDGSFAHRYKSRFGELTLSQAIEVLKICEKYGTRQLRIGCDQNIYIPGLPESVDLGGSCDRYAGVIACAGSKYCVYSLMDTKEESERLAWERAAERDISVGFSGCLKGCARHAFSDIGFVGIRTALYGEKTERGVRLYLGAEYSKEARAARLILYSVPLRCLNNMLDLLVTLFDLSGCNRFEEFASTVINRYSAEALAFWLLMNYYRRFVAKKGSLFIPEPKSCDDEKEYFVSLVEEEGVEEESEVISRLKMEEEFVFREAIIYLEKASFAVR